MSDIVTSGCELPARCGARRRHAEDARAATNAGLLVGVPIVSVMLLDA